jgi:outer membrane protein OmpA-like peptidoglycan-associated protein
MRSPNGFVASAIFLALAAGGCGASGAPAGAPDEAPPASMFDATAAGAAPAASGAPGASGAPAASGPPAAGTAAAKDVGLGSKIAVPFALAGKIYHLASGTHRLPADFSKLEPVGTVFAETLNVTPRRFDQGFPGVTDRFEWFAIDYHGSFSVERPGRYQFRVVSDDGAKILVDGKVVLDHDGLHSPTSKVGAPFDLAAGAHAIEVQYFQGPRHDIALVVELAPEGGKFELFHAGRVRPAEVATGTGGKTRVTLPDSILFDFDKDVLKPAAESVLAQVKATLLDAHAQSRIVVEGHTDDRGSDDYNRALSERRARAVALWLEKHGVDKTRLAPKGYGKRWPRVPNDSDASRAKNRRVEIVVLP